MFCEQVFYSLTGYFVKPTIFADVNNQMTVARTEIFGPVLSMIPFDTEEEAIKIANDTPYGLTNYVQTQDQEKAKRVSKKLLSGIVEVSATARPQLMRPQHTRARARAHVSS